MPGQRILLTAIAATVLMAAPTARPPRAAEWDRRPPTLPDHRGQRTHLPHDRPGRHCMRGPPPVVMVPGAHALVTVPPVGPPFPIQPPNRFHYFCREPSGYFPMVSVCASPWLEVGEP